MKVDKNLAGADLAQADTIDQASRPAKSTTDDRKPAGPSPRWPAEASPSVRRRKVLLSLRIDHDVLEWFREQGPGYQTRMNAVLRAYMEHTRKN